MVAEGLIGALVVGETLGYRRAMFGRPPQRPVRLTSGALVSLAIHIGFHAAATWAPWVPVKIAFIVAGWTTFFLWWKWLGRAADPWGFGEADDGGGGDGPGGGGGPGGGPSDRDDPRPGGTEREIDWDALEREMSDFISGEREPAGAR